jgi:hypothetical protein
MFLSGHRRTTGITTLANSILSEGLDWGWVARRVAFLGK